MKLIATVISTFLISGLAQAASFQGQTSFTTNPMWGWLTITCQEGGQSGHTSVLCEDLGLLPFEAAYFEAEKDVGATEVLLTSQRADGKTVDKKVGYDSVSGRSDKRVNLWIATLLQTPLLDVGNNVIDYQLVNSGEVKASGQFSVSVAAGEEKRCPDARASSFTMNDCRFPELMCGRYFQYFNYCE